jgi:hypothetical protein
MNQHLFIISPATPARSWKQHTLHTTAGEIERTLGFRPNQRNDIEGKVSKCWSFRVEGHPDIFSIWDWKGSAERGEWSAFGDGAVLDLLFPRKP